MGDSSIELNRVNFIRATGCGCNSSKKLMHCDGVNKKKSSLFFIYFVKCLHCRMFIWLKENVRRTTDEWASDCDQLKALESYIKWNISFGGTAAIFLLGENCRQIHIYKKKIDTIFFDERRCVHFFVWTLEIDGSQIVFYRSQSIEHEHWAEIWNRLSYFAVIQ